ncbi:hypothetical protein KQI86_00100 [Clostridium sp. MSJ-11]|uniref:5-bromo-4-chloroindolyl phosphate hydrolysis protein n=1 Tax=Clostridium mobile TaxID=2841512 RepID=A0ABS6EBY1_9CLOT|nr:hypothetical protein [Clostridium mobile]MBU5482702.1 hypothetical protein [Clostridium mobile]
MNTDKILFILIIILIISIVVCLIKKVAKFIIFVLVALFAFIVIKGVIDGKGPIDIFNSTKANAIYTKQLYDYTGKIKKSIDNSLESIDNKSFEKFKGENKKLNGYLKEVLKLPHEEELNSIHEKYCDYLKNIVKTSNALVESGKFTEDTLKDMERVKLSLTNYLKDLMSIQEKIK